MKKRLQFTGLATAAGIVLTLSALSPTMAAQSSGQGSGQGSGQSSGQGSGQNQNANRMMSADSGFATKAAEGGLAEVQLGQLAKDHASSQAVKDFGQRMVDDHTKANDQLKQLASNKGMMLPSNLNSKDQALYDRLSKLNGAAFDRAYMEDMVKDHKTDIAEFQREADHGSDPDLKSFASQTLPTLQSHLQMAESTYSQVKK